MRRTIRLSLGALLAALALLLPARPAAAIPPSPPTIDIDVDPSFESAASDGFWIAWVDQPDGGNGSYRLQARDRIGSPPITLSDKLAFAYYHAPLTPSYAVSAGRILWIDTSGSSLELDPAARLTLTTISLQQRGQSQQIAQGRVIFPGLDGDIATWWEVDDAGVRHLKRRDLSKAEEPADLLQLSGQFYGAFETRMSSHWQVWASSDSASTGHCWTLHALALDTGGEPKDLGLSNCSYRPQFDLVGHTLAYVLNDGALKVVDLASGAVERSGPHGSQALSTNGRFVLLAKKEGLWGFDTRSRSAFPIWQGGLPRGLSARGDGVVWQEGNTLHVQSIWNVLPTGSRPPAAGASHFPETGHNLGGEFLAYWKRNGGLPVFGYPLSEEFMQENASDGRGYAVQYLERQRFELHPENAGTPYIVLLGRLGAETLAARGVDWQSLPKASPRAPHYFPQTGQAIEPLFWNYWRSHGLELGDPGVSEREALALWGYPLSGLTNEVLLDGSVVQVQWYERARFEYHPENQEPYKVLLGRLAADSAEHLFR